MSGFGKPHFEPPVPDLVTEYDAAARVLEQFSDISLLLELRRRKVLARVTAEMVAPGHAVAAGYPLDAQLREAYWRLADQLNRAHTPDRQPPGCKLEQGRFLPWSPHAGDQGDRKVTLVLNYVVENKHGG